MSILDAMGYGLPIVSTNVGGIPKCVDDEISGYLSNPGDVNKMSKNIVKLLIDDKCRNDFASKSFQIAEEKYSLNAHLVKLEKIYDQV